VRNFDQNTVLDRDTLPYHLTKLHLALCNVIFPSCLMRYITLRSGVLQRLLAPDLIRKTPAFGSYRRFVTMFTRACHTFLFWAKLIQPTPCQSVYLGSVVTLFFRGFLSSSFSKQNASCIYLLHHACHTFRPHVSLI
jgi:hypothetical protein